MTTIEQLVADLREIPLQEDILAAADLLESQAARIAELEADKKALGDLLLRSDAQLVALRRKIDEAPVVAWKYQWDKGSDIWPHKLQGAELFDFIPDPHTVHPLISKEDLK